MVPEKPPVAITMGTPTSIFYIAEPAGIETSAALGQCAFWFDYDDDGKLDLFVKDYESPNRLYKNNGDGTLTQVPNAAGLADATLGA